MSMSRSDNSSRSNGVDSSSANIERSQPSDVIPAFDYRGSLRQQRSELIQAFERVLDSGSLILGPEVVAFQREWREYVGVAHAIGMSSGTDAIVVALKALDIGVGDQVITVANGPVPTTAAIRAVGAIPRFVDIDPMTLQISVDAVRSAINSRTAAIIPVHLYGMAADAYGLAQLCAQHGLALIEDCAQAHGTFVRDASGPVPHHVGRLGQVSCFSFYPTKNLGAFGDAGMCVTDDASLADQIRQIGCYGFQGDRIAHCDGLNCRLDELQAALLRVRLRYLEQAIQRRREIAARYQAGLQDLPIQLLQYSSDCVPAWHQFVIRVSDRPRWIAALSAKGIGVGVHYESPVHLMPAYVGLEYAPGSLPHTEAACQQVLSLPIYPELSDGQVDRVVCVLRQIALGPA